MPAFRKVSPVRHMIRVGVMAVAVAIAALVPKPALAAQTLYLYGPSSIYTSGNYQYLASFLVPYASFQWATRYCDTDTVASCSTTWNWAQGVPRDQFSQTYNKNLVPDCTPETSSFQVRVIGSGFGVPPQTVYKVTLLCGEPPF